VARLEERLSRSQTRTTGAGARELEDLLRRCLADMLTDDADIRGVLKELARDMRVDSTAARS
jgi:hypothetical protein